MRGRTAKMILVILLALCLAGISGFYASIPAVRSAPDKPRVGLILKMNRGYHWATVKMGADTAAREFDAELDFTAPDSDQDTDGQKRLIEQALARKLDVLVVSPIDMDLLRPVLESARLRIPVVLMDAPANAMNGVSVVATNAEVAGTQAATGLTARSNGKAGILMLFDAPLRDMDNLQQKGFLKGLEGHPDMKVIRNLYGDGTVATLRSATANAMETQPEIDTVVTFGELSSEAVVDTVRNIQRKIRVISLSSSPFVVDAMDQGMVDALVAEQPFSMGYLGVRTALAAVHQPQPVEYISPATRLIDRSTMYQPDNQRLLFPFLK